MDLINKNRVLRGRDAWAEEKTDSPQSALVGEVTTILDSLQVLSQHLRQVELHRQFIQPFYFPFSQAESAHKSLLATKAKLEYNIHVKTNSLVINVCLANR